MVEKKGLDDKTMTVIWLLLAGIVLIAPTVMLLPDSEVKDESYSVNSFNQDEGVIDTTLNGVPNEQVSFVTLPDGVREKVIVSGER